MKVLLLYEVLVQEVFYSASRLSDKSLLAIMYTKEVKRGYFNPLLNFSF